MSSHSLDETRNPPTFETLMNKAAPNSLFPHLNGPISKPTPLPPPQSKQTQMSSTQSKQIQITSPQSKQTKQSKPAQSKPVISAPPGSLRPLNPDLITDEKPLEPSTSDTSESDDSTIWEFQNNQYFSAATSRCQVLLKTDNTLNIVYDNDLIHMKGPTDENGSDMVSIDIVIVGTSILVATDKGFYALKFDDLPEYKWTSLSFADEHNTLIAVQLKCDPLNPNAFFCRTKSSLNKIYLHEGLLYDDSIPKWRKNVSGFDVSSKYVAVMKEETLEFYERNDTAVSPYVEFSRYITERLYCDDEYFYCQIGTNVDKYTIEPLPLFVETFTNIIQIWSSESISMLQTNFNVRLEGLVIPPDYRIVAVTHSRNFTRGLVMWSDSIDKPIALNSIPLPSPPNRSINPEIIIELDHCFDDHVKAYFAEHDKYITTFETMMKSKFAKAASHVKNLATRTESLIIHGNTPAAVVKRYDAGRQLDAIQLACNYSIDHILALGLDRIARFADQIPPATLIAIAEIIFSSAASTNKNNLVVPILFTVLVALPIDDLFVQSVMGSKANAMLEVVIELFQRTKPTEPYFKDLRKISHILMAFKQ